MSSVREDLPVLFVTASDTLVRLLMPVATAIEAAGHRVVFAKLQFTDESAEFELAQHRPRSDYVGSVRHHAAWWRNYRAVVMGNDWGREARSMILLARRLGLPTICVQESVIDFTGPLRRMRHAEHVLVQGAVSARMLAGRERISVTGNPRYETLAITPADPASDVLLNCNFTYGVEEQNRHAWLKAAIDACDAAARSVTILQHPRDVSDLSAYGRRIVRTNAGTIHDRLRQGGVVVTRFSSLIHEAIALGRPAVYFNPHQEHVGYDFGPSCAVLRRATSGAELVSALTSLTNAPPVRADFEAYLREHVRPLETLPSVACAQAIVQICQAGAAAAGVPAGADTARRFGLLSYCIAEKFYLLARDRL